MTLRNEKLRASFVEEHWLAEQERRGRKLFAWVEHWLALRALGEPLEQRVRARALPWTSGWVEGPGTFVLCAAESFGLSEEQQRLLGIAANLFWAAADVADDVDDGEEQAGMKPQANDACALLFLASEALGEIGPQAVAMGNHYGLRMALGQARDLAATDRPNPYDVEAIARDKAGAEVAFFLSLVATAAGVPTAPFARLGEALGVLIQTFSDVADLYVASHSLDLESGKLTPVLKAFLAADPRRAETLLATPRAWAEVQAALRFEMRDAALAALASLDGPAVSAWADARPYVKYPKVLEELVLWMLGLVEITRSALAELEQPDPVNLPSSDTVLERARGFLESGPFVEQHRWGLFQDPLVTGDLFPNILATAALRELGGNWEHGLKEIGNKFEDGGWRYYPGRTEIPVDADDTGLVLGHFADALPVTTREAGLTRLLGGFNAEGIHTWLGKATADIEWLGDDCTATLSNATWALLRHGKGSSVPTHVWPRLLRHVTDGDFESPFYTQEATRFFIHRSLALANRLGFVGNEELGRVREGYAAWYEAKRRWGGATESSLLATTMNALAAMELGLKPPGDLATYLATRQGIDGSWPGEPLFMIPGVNYRSVRWGHPSVTTSFVVFALLRLRDLGR